MASYSTNNNTDKNIDIVIEKTPHPQALKFSFNCSVAPQTLEISSMDQASRSPIAQKILGFPWVKKIFIGFDFITITKEDWVDWDIVSDPLCQLIKEHIKNGEKILYPLVNPSNKPDSKKNIPNANPIVQKIKQILEKDIQPAVAMDGGFISFAGYENGRVFLKMQGACSGCPSASLTLKQGVENHLKNHISEIKEVVAL